MLNSTKPFFFFLIFFTLPFLNCQQKLQSQPDQQEGIGTYRKDVVVNYNFEKDPLKSDIGSILSPTFEACRVKDNAIIDALKQHRHYYDLLYYSKIPSESHDLFTVLGYYDLYTDLWLISIEDKKPVDWVLIASILGDADDFTHVTSEFRNGDQFEIVEIEGKLVFSKPDSTFIQSKVESIVRIDEHGKFNQKVISSFKADNGFKKRN